MADSFSYRPFMDLKKLVKIKDTPALPPPAKKQRNTKTKENPQPDEKKPEEKELSEEEIFQNAMAEVREIKEFRAIAYTPSAHRKTIHPQSGRSRSETKDLSDIVEGKVAIDIKNTQEYVAWYNADSCGPGVKHIPELLHGGTFSVQDSLDLHGYTLDQAQAITETFLKHSSMNSLRCVKIIHGRGLRSPQGPVLKGAIVRWLSGRLRKYVAAFATARQCDGGAGAVYVLLRRR